MSKNDRYETLQDYIGLVLDARWYGLNRSLGLSMTRERRTYGPLEIEVVVRDEDYYHTNGLSSKDLIAIWFDQFHFYVIAFKTYDRIYKQVIENTSIHPQDIETMMVDSLMELTNKIKQKSHYED